MEQLSLTVPDKACYLCLKENTPCDGQRPCARCKETKRSHVCFGSELQGKIASSTSGTVPVTHKTHALGSTASDAARKRKRVKLKDDSSEASNPQTQPVLAENVGALSQVQLNHYLVEELAKMRVEQLRMNQQLQTMQAINMELINQMRVLQERFSALQLQAPLATASTGNVNAVETSTGAAANSEELAMVVFDLVRVPPIVLTANGKFCRLFGYTLEEVVGKPWQSFIHPEHLARTFAQLQQATLSGAKLQLVQVYVDKLGRPFVAQDTHTFFVAQGNVALADFVTIVPLDPTRLVSSTSAVTSSTATAGNASSGSSSPLTQTLIFGASSPIQQPRIVHDSSLVDSPQLSSSQLLGDTAHSLAFAPLPNVRESTSAHDSPVSDADALMGDATGDLDLDALSLDQMNLSTGDGSDADEAHFARYFAS